MIANRFDRRPPRRIARTAVRTLRLLVLVAALGACGGPKRAEPPRIAFEDGPLLRLEAQRPVNVVELYRAPLSRPHVEHEFAIVPAQIANAWVRDRLALSGTGGEVKVTIHDASVIEEPVPVSTGLFAWLRDDVNRRLTGKLDVQIDFIGVAGEAGSARAEVSATRSLREGDKPEKVQAIYFQMIRDLADGFDSEMARQIDRAFVRARSGAA